jgi:kynurenine formamidase
MTVERAGGSGRRALVAPSAAVALLALAACSSPAPPDYTAVFDGSAGRWVDLTYAFGPSTIYWPADTAGFRLDELAFGRTEAGYFYSSYELGTAEHGGTHLDAPIHFAEGGLSADEIPLAGLIGPAAVVDVTERAHPDYLVTVADLEAWEASHGELPNGGILLLRTGWGARWGDRTAYLGTEIIGPDAVPELHFPGLAPEAAQWLVDERGVVAVGIDTPSIDYGQSADFRSHVTLYSANVSGFENVANLDLLPESGAFIVALPMKIEGGSGGPLRIVGFVPSPGS